MDPLLLEGGRWESKNGSIQLGIEKGHPPSLIIQIYSDPLGLPEQKQASPARGQALQLAPALLYCPNALLWAEAEAPFPPHGLLGDADGPVLPLLDVHHPGVFPRAEALAAQHEELGIKSLRIVQQGLCVIQVGDCLLIQGEEEVGIGCTWIQSHTETGGD